MDDPSIKRIYAKAIGDLMLRYFEQQGCPAPDIVESRALALISRIQEVLDDETLEDPDCFYRIDAIVGLFYDTGLYTSRHDFG